MCVEQIQRMLPQVETGMYARKMQLIKYKEKLLELIIASYTTRIRLYLSEKNSMNWCIEKHSYSENEEHMTTQGYRISNAYILSNSQR